LRDASARNRERPSFIHPSRRLLQCATTQSTSIKTALAAPGRELTIQALSLRIPRKARQSIRS
jgi:hypothetical protein